MNINGTAVPDSKLAREITEFVRDTETELLFNHSSRVYYFGALAGVYRGLKYDAELLYAGDVPRRRPDTIAQQSWRAIRSGRSERRPRLSKATRHQRSRYRSRMDIDCAAYDAGHYATYASGDRTRQRRRQMDVLGLTYRQYSATRSDRPSCTRILVRGISRKTSFRPSMTGQNTSLIRRSAM
ncbi:metal dependent phosphohydrolase [Candidatus Paraburkholderia calva]|nr:metal dependent phosphohydrolase [Candidatus Paraburkholderia calva]